MRRAKSRKSDGWAELLQTALVQASVGRPAGEGWKTVAEFAAEVGRSESRADRILKKLHDEGKLEMQRGRLSSTGNWLKFYRPI